MVETEPHDRQARIAELRRAIQAGTYETPEKLEAAVEAFLGEHRAGRVRPGHNRPPRPK